MVVCKVKHHKEDPNRTRITVTGSQICYPRDVGTPTGSLNLVKIIINSVLSRRNALFVSFDLKILSPNPNGAIRICVHQVLGYPSRIN